MNTASPRSNRAPLNLAMGWVGLVAAIAAVVGHLAGLGSGFFGICVLAVAASLVLMYATRKSDEYTLSLWSSATNAAFAMILVWMLAAPAIEGFFDGLLGIENGQDFPSQAAPLASILAFYLVFNVKRLTGAM